MQSKWDAASAVCTSVTSMHYFDAIWLRISLLIIKYARLFHLWQNKVTISKPLSWLWFNGKNVLPIQIKCKNNVSIQTEKMPVSLKYPLAKQGIYLKWQPLGSYYMCRELKTGEEISVYITNEWMRDFMRIDNDLFPNGSNTELNDLAEYFSLYWT